mmetsp:Transcript_4926/g.7469  ORF Transcript_4926/g.7469 Transcript_4926/m.7469 type:complete len:260 (+) Transcript_4926:152-931(+)|eukprot:CAMPEP_0195285616 /NCGR_PEP_ID=MMETSP0707-20130614/3386_1 /TAXON_ID=33640 /ORGANISM="Asterionellopsis glacialis, Strain CCMP134" /LENGTH=259 /DNA_ID=CAMNT_0040345139 /DNA_START=94 /DNA_END=873 /DNA_ORIENTATION=+
MKMMVPSKFFFIITALLALYCRAADDDGNYNDDNAGDDDSYQTPVEICEDMLVTVTAIQVLCDSPKTYYYGSGVNRNSLVCDYGDKATITVDFDVQMDVGDDVDIFLTMAVYSENGEKLYAGGSKDLSQNYVGSDCTYQGSYQFSTQVYLSDTGGGDEKFGPIVEMAFSYEANGGSSLGGANIGECVADDGTSTSFVSWYNSQTENAGKDFFRNYSILFMTLSCVGAFAGGLYMMSKEQNKISAEGIEEASNFELMERP